MTDDPTCTDCEGTGITTQTERYCTCDAGAEVALTDSEWECDDDMDDEDAFDCHMGPDGHCGAAGSEMCDFECPTMRAYRDGSLPS